ncbi:MAG: 5-formyltetrahydrofolate cyclo-ligase [Armatimonadota bacterium]
MPLDPQSAKAEIRAAMLERRNALPPETIAEHSAVIARRVTELPIFAAAKTVCSFLSFGSEVRTADIICAALDAGKRVALPRTVKEERRLVLHQVDSLDHLQPGPYGILEPAPDAPVVDPAEVEFFIVPGAAFDSTGGRIGYGAGYYDELLVMSEGWRVAVAFAFQIAPRVPVVVHDEPMDLIVTECGIIDCARGQQRADHLRLRNMNFYGHHGAFPQEREHGIRFAVDVDLRLDLQWPGLTDDLATTVNYPVVYRLIQRLQSDRQFTLFEAMAEHIADALLEEFPVVLEVTVVARKFNPPVGGPMDAFEVEITRSRPAWME